MKTQYTAKMLHLLVAAAMATGLIPATPAGGRHTGPAGLPMSLVEEGPAETTSPVLALVAPAGPQPATGVIEVELTVTGAADLAAFEFDLVVDPSLVQVTGITADAFMGATSACDPYTARCAVTLGPLDLDDATALGAYTYGTGTGAGGDGVLAVIHLQPTGLAGTTPLSITYPLLADTAGVTEIPAVQNTTLELVEPPGANVYLPLLVVGGAAIAHGGVLGHGLTRAIPPLPTASAACPDLTGDGIVDSDDVTTIAARWRSCSNDPDWDPFFDLVEDGRINIADIAKVSAAWGSQCPNLPPDPATVAPPIDMTVPTDLAPATRFLYTGADPIQTGVVSGTIQTQRVAVLRGRALTRLGEPLSAITVTILAHPEFGQTLTREDGRFDLVVNGGGPLTVNYVGAGYLPAQRQVDVPWQEYVWLPDVVLIPADNQATVVDLTAPVPIQVARGSVISDTDGARQATLLVPQGVGAELVLPGGLTQTVTSLTVRATEYTVGPGGPSAMPAELPPISAYTYAVELSADEALAAEAVDLRFDQALPFYVENFLGFPVGGAVPVGYYDRAHGVWVAAPNGRVIEILSVTGGMVDLDTNGDGLPDDAGTLAALGITDAEREQLASLYAPGTTLWRVPITHFTPWDCNWPYGLPDGAGAPDGGAPSGAGAGGGSGGGAGGSGSGGGGGLPGDDGDDDDDDDGKCEGECCTEGSIIGCLSQTLGESFSLTGTGFRLHYESDRVPGYSADHTLRIPLSSSSVPTSLLRIELEIGVAGWLFTETFPAAPDQVYTFSWDGFDAYGRALQGDQPYTVRIGFVYPAVYRTPAENERAFGQYGNAIMANRLRHEITVWQEWRGFMGIWDARSEGLGGWTLSVHHNYVPLRQILYQGTGRRYQAAGTTSLVIDTVAGTGEDCSYQNWPTCGDGGPATEAPIGIARAVAAAPDGGLYVVENNRIRRVGPDGIMSTIGPIPLLFQPTDIAVGPDSSLYVTDPDHYQIHRFWPDGAMTTVAGTGGWCYPTDACGDGGPATDAQFASPVAVAAATDGSLYVADHRRVRRIGTDGIITTVAGTGETCYSPMAGCGDGGSATAAQVEAKNLVVGPDGSLYLADTYHYRVRRVGPEGIITTVAGTGDYCHYPHWPVCGDGGPGTEAQITPLDVALGTEGSLYISEVTLVRRVAPHGTITTITGRRGSQGYGGDGGPAGQALLWNPSGINLGPDDALYIADHLNRRVRRVGAAQTAMSISDMIIPSESGNRLYLFDGQSRHLRTLDALTGAVRYWLSYDATGRLTTVTDGYGNVTTVERDADGNPTAVVGPYGQRTVLALDANGFLASITNPAGETVQLESTPGGLLTGLTDPRGNVSHYVYDELGRLVRGEDAAGGFKTLDRTEQGLTYTVTLATATGTTTTYRVETLETGGQRWVNILPSGLETERLRDADGTTTVRLPDGTEISATAAPNPRWGMLAPYQGETSVSTPAGRTTTYAVTQQAVLSDSLDILSLSRLTSTVTVNGRVSTSLYDAESRTVTGTSPSGRQYVISLDAHTRLTQVQTAGLLPANLAYDSYGRLISVTVGTGPDARVTNLTYDSDGWLETLADPLGREVSLAYDEAGRAVTKTLPDGRAIELGYDAGGNVATITPPSRPAHSFGYTPLDLTSVYTPPAAISGTGSTGYAYNADRRLTLITRPDGLTVDFDYDTAGRLSTLTLPRGLVTYGYHPATGRLATLAAPGAFTQTYSYDGFLLTGETWLGTIAGNVGWTYDDDSRPTASRLNGGNEISYEYDQDGLLIRAGDLTLDRDPQNGLLIGTTLGQVSDEQSHNGFGELVNYQAAFSGTNLLAHDYAYDRLGRITAITETINGAVDVTGYTYDLAGRLVESWENGILLAAIAYDGNGNRLSYTGPGGTVTATVDLQDRLTALGSTTYSYTLNGELLNRTAGGQTTTYGYDVLGNLTAVTLPDGTQIDYLVDGRNRRVGVKVDGVLVQGFLYQGKLRPIAELNGSMEVVSRFVYASRSNVPDYLVRGGVTYRILTDHLGSPRLVVNVATGEIVQRMDYDPFGVVISDTSPGFQPFGFAGGLYDRHTGLTRFGARDYDAETGRWTAKDLILFSGGDTNLYGYVLNDPVNLRDPSGLAPEFLRAWREGAIDLLKDMVPTNDDPLAVTILSPLWLIPCGPFIALFGIGYPTLLENALDSFYDPWGIREWGTAEIPPLWEDGDRATRPRQPGPQCTPDDSISPDAPECVGGD